MLDWQGFRRLNHNFKLQVRSGDTSCLIRARGNVKVRVDLFTYVAMYTWQENLPVLAGVAGHSPNLLIDFLTTHNTAPDALLIQL